MSVDGLSSPDEEPILGAHFLSTILRRISVVDDRSDSYPSYTPTLPNVSLTTSPRVTPRRNEALPDYTLNSSESLSDLFDAVRQMSAVMEQLNHLRSLQRLHRGSRARMLFLSNLSTLNETHFDRSDSILNAQSENSSLDDLILQYAVQLSLQSEQPTVPPATKQAMKKLMRVTLQHSDSEILDCNRCPICLRGYESGARVIRMPCEHIFDEECVLKWLEQNRSCPICRKHVCEEHADTPPRQNESQGDASELTNAFQFLNNGVAEFPTDSEQGENIALAELTVSTSSRGDSISNGTIEDYSVETTSVASSDITPPRIRNIRVISTSSPGRESSPGDSLLSFDSTGELSENSNLDSFISTSHSTHVTRTRWFPPRPSVIQDVELSSMRVRTEHVSSRVPPPSSSFLRRRLSSILRDSTAVSVLTDVNRSPLVIPEPQHLSSNTYFGGVHLLRSNSRVSLLDWRRQRNAA